MSGRVLLADLTPGETRRALRAEGLHLVTGACTVHVRTGLPSLVTTLRAAAPLVRLLVTSQETLKVAEEHVYRVGSLAPLCTESP